MMVNDKREERDMIYPTKLVLKPDGLAEFYKSLISTSCKLVKIYRYEQDLYDRLLSSNDTNIVNNTRSLINYESLSDDFIDACLNFILISSPWFRYNKPMVIEDFVMDVNHIHQRDYDILNILIDIIINTNKPLVWLRKYSMLIDQYTIKYIMSNINNVPIDLVCTLINHIPKKKLRHLDLTHVNECKEEIYQYPKTTNRIVKLLLKDTHHNSVVSKDVRLDFINNIPYKLDILELIDYNKQ